MVSLRKEISTLRNFLTFRFFGREIFSARPSSSSGSGFHCINPWLNEYCTVRVFLGVLSIQYLHLNSLVVMMHDNYNESLLTYDFILFGKKPRTLKTVK